MKSVVVFISGNGSNLQRVIDTLHNYTIKIKLVVSNRKNAYGLTRAILAGIPTLYLPYLSKKMERIEYDLHLAEQVKSIVPDLKYILCLGWMHILSAEFINQFPPKTIVNLHPALPGKFPGKDAVAEAFKYYSQECNRSNNMYTGAMVHYVIPEVDAGKVIDTIKIPIYKTDTLETLRYRVYHSEKELLLTALRKII